MSLKPSGGGFRFDECLMAGIFGMEIGRKSKQVEYDEKISSTETLCCKRLNLEISNRSLVDGRNKLGRGSRSASTRLS